MALDFQNLPVERFWRFVDRIEESSCWMWKGAVDKDGYGVFGFSAKTKSIRAHRFAWIATYGDPGALFVLHRCDVRGCVNPAHLFLGTAKDNTEDMIKKGRHRPGMKGRFDLAKRGEEHHRTTLTEEQVRCIKREYRPRRVPLILFAKKFNVSLATVHNIVAGFTWKHIQS